MLNFGINSSKRTAPAGADVKVSRRTNQVRFYDQGLNKLGFTTSDEVKYLFAASGDKAYVWLGTESPGEGMKPFKITDKGVSTSPISVGVVYGSLDVELSAVEVLKRDAKNEIVMDGDEPVYVTKNIENDVLFTIDTENPIQHKDLTLYPLTVVKEEAPSKERFMPNRR